MVRRPIWAWRWWPRGARPRLLLDSAASGTPIAEGGPPAVFSWTVWPDAAEPVLVLVNRSMKASAKVASVELREMTADPSPATLAETHPEAPRPLSLHLASHSALDRFGGTVEGGPDDVFGLARNLCTYVGQCGAPAWSWPTTFATAPAGRPSTGRRREDSADPTGLTLPKIKGETKIKGGHSK